MAQGYRTETDSLGSLKVPTDAYYGVQTARAVENFPISSYRSHPALILTYVHIKRAAAEVNAKLGMLEGRQRDGIIKACDSILNDAAKLLKRDPFAKDRSASLLDHWVVDIYQAGAGTSFNMNTNEVIANLANERFGKTPAEKERGTYLFVHPNDHVNMAQSTNDTMPTAIRLSNLVLLPETLASLDKLEEQLRKKARDFRTIITTGRTHLQDATPIALGQVFMAFADCLKKSRARLAVAGDALRIIGIGGTAVGTGMNSDPRYAKEVTKQIAKQMGLKLESAKNIVEMHSSMADQLNFSSAMRNLAADLNRISNDLRLLSSGPTSGIGEINLPPVQPGSSIMPGKVNPVMLEMFNMVCYQIIGLDTSNLGCSQAGQYQLNVMMPMIAYNLLHMQVILANSMRVVADRCISGITANRSRCKHYFESSMGLATVLSPVIGYNAAAKIVKAAVEKGTPIMDELKAAVDDDGKPVLTEKDLKEIFKPEKLTKPGSAKLKR